MTSEQDSLRLQSDSEAGQSDRGQRSQSAWTDTIDDWDAILDGDEQDEAIDSTDSPSVTDSNGADSATAIQTDGGITVDRIDPISEPLAEAAVEVLPEPWLTDSDAQRLVQWVVYAFAEQTDPKQGVGTRVNAAIAHAAARTETNPAMLKQLCTNSLYRGRSGAGTNHFQSDLVTISRRATASTRSN